MSTIIIYAEHRILSNVDTPKTASKITDVSIKYILYSKKATGGKY